MKKLQVFINKCLKRILNIKWYHKVNNEDLLKKAKLKPVEAKIKKRKWKWIGHVLRKPEKFKAKQALDWNPQGHRKRGRSRTTWRRTIEKELKDLGITWKEAKHLATNRVRWKNLTEALCSSNGMQEV